MKTRGKSLIILLALLFFNNAYSQEKEYTISEQLKSNAKNCQAFEIKEINITTKTYEYKQIENPEYIKIINEIKAIENKIKGLKNSKDTRQQEVNLTKAKIHLEKAIKYQKENTDFFSLGKWIDIRMAKDYLDDSGIKFKQTTRKNYELAITEAKENIKKIESIEATFLQKEQEIADLHNQKLSLERKIGKGYIGYNSNVVKEKIWGYAPIGEINRNTLIVDTINVISKLRGTFIAVDNNYQSSKGFYLLKEPFRRFIKNELVPKDTVDKYIPYPRHREKPEKEGIQNFDFRYGDTDSYLIKNKKTGTVYYTKGNILSTLAMSKNEYKLANKLKKIGARIIEENNQLYVLKGNEKCILTESIKKEFLNNNVNIIHQTVSAVKQYNLYYNQALKLLSKVTKHRQAYNLKTMTASRLTKWKTDLRSLILINKKMTNLHYGKYKNNISSDLAYKYFIDFNKHLTQEQINAGIVISDMIRECKIITGI